MSRRSKRKPLSTEVQVVCTACEEVMLQTQMGAHDVLPEHRRNVTSLLIDRAIAKAGFGRVCNVREVSMQRGY